MTTTWTKASMRDHVAQLLHIPGADPPKLTVTPRDNHRRRVASWSAHHYEIMTYYTTTTPQVLEDLEARVRRIPGVYVTTRIVGVAPGRTMFSNPGWPEECGPIPRDRNALRPMVIGLIDPAKADEDDVLCD